MKLCFSSTFHLYLPIIITVSMKLTTPLLHELRHEAINVAKNVLFVSKGFSAVYCNIYMYICNKEIWHSSVTLRQISEPIKIHQHRLACFDTKLWVPSSDLTSVSRCIKLSVPDFDFMIRALVYLFHQYFFFVCLNWHIYSTCLFIPQFKTSPYPWVWIWWILQRIGWIREYHCIPIIRPEPI